MKVGVDSYCFHRYFGELWPGVDDDPGKSWSAFDFVAFARETEGVSGVSLETCFMPSLDPGFLRDLRAALDEAGLDRVLAWGHPTGLECGTSAAALANLRRHLASALAIGATTMRIVASITPYSPELEARYSRDLVPVLREAARAAADQGVVLAIENHGDFVSDSLLRLLEQVDSPALRVTLDTGNARRVLEDPVEATRKLAPFVAATHIKDVTREMRAGAGSSPSVPVWPASVVGLGEIDVPAIVQILHDAGYEGLLCIEIDGPAKIWRQLPEEELVRQSVIYLSSLVGSG